MCEMIHCNSKQFFFLISCCALSEIHYFKGFRQAEQLFAIAVNDVTRTTISTGHFNRVSQMHFLEQVICVFDQKKKCFAVSRHDVSVMS